LPHELIAELSRLRWLLVTARGSSFRLRSIAMPTWAKIGRLLGVRYCLSGTVEVAEHETGLVTVELVDTRNGGIVWADRFAGVLDAVHQIRADIRARILAALEIQHPPA
jgi:TolB-like protein